MVVLHYKCHCLHHTADDCLDEIYVLGFTSGKKHAGAQDCHSIEIRANGETRIIKLPNLEGDDYKEDKGDLWKIEINDFGFDEGCIELDDVEAIAIHASNNDGWNIESIVTFFKSNPDSYQLASVDFEVNRWIDGNRDDSHERFQLNMVL